MPKTKKKTPAPGKTGAKKRAPGKKAKATKSHAQPSNVISFAELYELRKKRLAEAQQQQTGWKDGTTGNVVATQAHEPMPVPHAPLNLRNGKTNGKGSRHH